MHCQHGCRPLLTFTPHDHTRTHNKHKPTSKKISSRSSRFSSSSQPPPPSLRPARGPPHTTTSLAVTLDGFSETRPCPEGWGGGAPLLLLLTHDALSAVISGLGSHQSAQQRWLPAASPAALTGEEAARGAGREAAAISILSCDRFKVPLRRVQSGLH